MKYNHVHKADRIGWIRAVVLGANDGIVSAHVGGASKMKGGLRVLFWGVLAMLVSNAIGSLLEVKL